MAGIEGSSPAARACYAAVAASLPRRLIPPAPCRMLHRSDTPPFRSHFHRSLSAHARSPSCRSHTCRSQSPGSGRSGAAAKGGASRRAYISMRRESKNRQDRQVAERLPHGPRPRCQSIPLPAGNRRSAPKKDPRDARNAATIGHSLLRDLRGEPTLSSAPSAVPHTHNGPAELTAGPLSSYTGPVPGGRDLAPHRTTPRREGAP